MNLSNKENPLISVYMATHKRPDYLKRSIKSVLKQTYKNFELVVVDDGSNDSTESVLIDFKKQDNRLVYFICKEPRGANFARNKAILESKGEFITGIDDDDWFDENRLLELFEQYNPKYSAVATNFFYSKNSVLKKSKTKVGEICLDDILFSNEVGNQVLVEKSRIINIGLYDESMVSMQDYELWIRLISKYGSIKKIDSPTYYVYEHDGQRITSTEKRMKGLKQLKEKHIDKFTVDHNVFLDMKLQTCSGFSFKFFVYYLKKGYLIFPLKQYLKWLLRK